MRDSYIYYIIKVGLNFYSEILFRNGEFINRLRDGSEYWLEESWREAYGEYTRGKYIIERKTHADK